ncbi:hypothetical protein [Burkholderia sp. IDO3]|uniref:hypothetical protein n=1 Tax=Burkholderia sp. IDO3 TaxID=1705310 RepID=UPI000BBB4A37|nr:hypothetical protein [Burkholderia sp. IDO3]AXK67246.1 hypothetical protein DCN14_31795 [Burkholderia sp. IDO3]PCD56924.1 hypothetical protein CN645_36770 [Burkholderia sp. IDO3]
MRIPSPTITLARRTAAYAPSDLGACAWRLLPVETRQAEAEPAGMHAFDANPIFRCRLAGRYAAGLPLNAACGNAYATVRLLAESHVDTVSRLRIRHAQYDDGARPQ